MKTGFALLFLLGCAALGCAGLHKDSEDFMDDLRTFQEGLRWRKYDMSVEYLPTRVREKFLDAHNEMDVDLRIDEYDIQVVHLEKEHRGATVQVKYTWHLDSVGTVHDTVIEERWKKLGKAWQIVEATYKRGDHDMPTVLDLQVDKVDQDQVDKDKVDKG